MLCANHYLQAHIDACRSGLESQLAAYQRRDVAAAGKEPIVVVRFHETVRERRSVVPRGNAGAPLTGVFSTRSPARLNPLGLHRVTSPEIAGSRSRIGPMEAIDGPPVVDVKPVRPELVDA